MRHLHFDNPGDAVLARAALLDGALWPESISGVFEIESGTGRLVFVPMLRFDAGVFDPARDWADGDDIDMGYVWNVLGHRLEDPEVAEAVAVLVIEWKDVGKTLRIAFDLRSPMRNVFAMLYESRGMMSLTDAPKGAVGATVCCSLENMFVKGDMGLDFALQLAAEIQKRPDLQRES